MVCSFRANTGMRPSDTKFLTKAGSKTPWAAEANVSGILQV